MEQNQYNQQPQYQQTYRPTMSFGTALKTCWKKFFDFTGRARRSEYWWFVLFCFIVEFTWALFSVFFMMGFLLAADVSEAPFTMTPLWIFLAVIMLPILVLMIPQYSAMTRRLHDTGRSGWWVVVSLLVSLLYMCLYAHIMLPMFASIGQEEFVTSVDAMKMAMQNSPTMLASYIVVWLASLALSIVLFVFTLLDSHREENKYGPSPKYQ